MFNKLSFEELSNFYGALADLEKHYGKETVRKAAEEMAARLDRSGSKVEPRITFDGKALADLMIPTTIPDGQLSLLPIEPDQDLIQVEEEPPKKKRNVTHRSSPGQNEFKIRQWCKENYEETPEETLLSLYYRDGYSQSKIAEFIGVKQRAVGHFIKQIDERKKKRIMSKWENKDQ
jgi:hypothetical protein